MKLGTRRSVWKLCRERKLIVSQDICSECKKAKHCNPDIVVRKEKVVKRGTSKKSKSTNYSLCSKRKLLVTIEACKQCDEYGKSCKGIVS